MELGKVYSEDPIIVTVNSTMAGNVSVRMPRVVCVVTCNKRTERLSCTVSKDNIVARFNLSDTLNGILMNYEKYDVDDDGEPRKMNYSLPFEYSFEEVYYFDGEKKTDALEGGSGRVVPGKRSDYRLLRHGDALPFISLKQNFFGEEHVLRGFPYLISKENPNIDSDLVRYRDYTLLPEGSRNLCVIDYNPMMHHPIIFRNSFGELETCLAWCRQKIDVKVQQDVYVTSRAAYDGQRTQMVDAYDDEMQIALTSGCVTPMWAQWWTFEPLRSRRAWIWMPTDLTTAAGTWVPCILSADNNTILDRSKGASEINFTAVLDWQGGLL